MTDCEGLCRIKAKISPAQKDALSQLRRRLSALEEMNHGAAARITEQDVVIRGVALLCRQNGITWPGATAPAQKKQQTRAAPIPAPTQPAARKKPILWDDQPLGQLSDKELAERLGVKLRVVCMARVRREIPAFEEP